MSADLRKGVSMMNKKINIWKLLGIIAFVAVINFGLAGCKTDADDDDGGGGGSDTALVGKWYATQAGADSETSTALRFEFTSDGKMLDYRDDSAYIYTASGGTLTVKSSGGQILETATYTISGTELTLFDIDDPNAIPVTFYKKAS
jgi:hypothetical protein